MRKMHLRLVTKADFRKNEVSQLQEHQYQVGNLKPGDVICFISKTGAMMRFVFRPETYENLTPARGNRINTHTVVESRLYRITGGGTWNPLMIKNYAREVDIELVGLRLFEEYFLPHTSRKEKTNGNQA